MCVGETTKTLSLAFDTDENIRHSPVSQTRVTNENKSQWVLAKSRQIFYQCETQAYAHLRLGLEDVLPNLQMFAPEELQTLVRGPASIDIAELRANTIYRGYAPHDRVIQDFWSLLETSWSIEQLEQLLCFWSGSPRPPMFGFVPSLASDEVSILVYSDICIFTDIHRYLYSQIFTDIHIHRYSQIFIFTDIHIHIC